MNRISNNQWICFKTKSREEFVANTVLVSKGFEVFMPYYFKTIKHARKIFKIKAPLFTSYGFIKYDECQSSLNTIRFSRGVKYYIQNENGNPKLISNKTISLIKKFRSKDGSFYFDPDRFKCGDKINIFEGTLSGLKAIFQEKIDDYRVSLLINFLGRINKVTINNSIIEKI